MLQKKAAAAVSRRSLFPGVARIRYNTRMTSSPCPCTSGKAFAACCEPYLSGKTLAPTAEALMRARYASYATGRIDFIETSHAPETRGDFNRETALAWSKGSKWLGLEVVAGDRVETLVIEYEREELAKFIGRDCRFHMLGVAERVADDDGAIGQDL